MYFTGKTAILDSSITDKITSYKKIVERTETIGYFPYKNA